MSFMGRKYKEEDDFWKEFYDKQPMPPNNFLMPKTSKEIEAALIASLNPSDGETVKIP